MTFGLRFALLEKKLGEIDRARQIFKYIGQRCDPERDTHKYWEVPYPTKNLLNKKSNMRILRFTLAMKTHSRR